MFSGQYRKTRPFFIIADILLIWLAFEIAYATRGHLPLERPFYLSNSTQALLALSSSLAWVMVGVWSEGYDAILRNRWSEALAGAVRQSLWATAALVFLQYVQRLEDYSLSRAFVALLWLYAVVLLTAVRMAAQTVIRCIQGADFARRHVYVAGTGATALHVARLIEENEAFGLRLQGFFDNKPGHVELDRTYEVIELARLQEILQFRIVDEIVFVMGVERLASLEEALLLCEEEGVRTRIHVEFFHNVHSRVHLERLGSEPLLTFSSAPHDEVRLVIKRMTDCVGALVALVLLSPLLLTIAVTIRVSSPGPVIFRQWRCGLNGRRFVLYKFRTMVEDAEARRAEVEHMNIKTTAFKIPNDPRLTPIGKWMRRLSLDELPQLWNVVRGEMSIVGPRPPVPDEVARYKQWQRRRLRMRPGLTCLWTLAGRDEVPFDDWMMLDLKYIDEWSLSLDWIIILRTIPQVLLGKGAS